MTLRWDARSIAGGAVLAIVLLGGALIVQHLRHGWPFSLHHGVDTREAVATREEPSASHPRAAVDLDPSGLEAIGVRSELVRRETIARPFRAVAVVVPDESRISHVHTRVAGYIDRLYVDTTGESVRAGQALVGIFSQELLSSQNEYLSIRRSAAGSPASGVLEGARARLRVLGMSDPQIRAIEASGEARPVVTVSSPRAGVVVHRGVSVGTAVDPSTELVTIADLSRVWIFAEVAESEIPNVEVGTPARLEFAASGRPPFEARVAFLSPTLSERTRTLRVRFEVENGDGSLRPGLYGSADFEVSPREALTVSRDAVVDTGEVQHVFVAAESGRFEPRGVVLGTRLGERVEVREGLAEGESVVSSGVFLIDSESRLRASGGAGTGHQHGGSGGADEEPVSPESPDESEAPSEHAHPAPRGASPTPIAIPDERREAAPPARSPETPGPPNAPSRDVSAPEEPPHAPHRHGGPP